MRLCNNVAIVTGSSRNIGQGIAQRLADEGAAIVVHGIDGDEVAATTSMIKDAGAAAVGVTVDIAQPDGADTLVERTLSAFGRLDILVNNAAVTAVIRPFLELTPELCRQIVDVNLLGMLQCSLAAARVMADQGGGCIVNVSSVGAGRAHRNMVAYDASKGGLEAASRAMAIDLAPYGIRVNTVQPGLVHTDRWNGVAEAELTRRRRAVPLGRAATIADVAGVVAFLCSADAAYVTGATITVDGGLSAQLRTQDTDLSAPTDNNRYLPLEEP
jgi:3-oxoacyl-[acyl-carrier protein] reductase